MKVGNLFIFWHFCLQKTLSESDEESELLPDGWNINKTSYALRYKYQNDVFILLGMVVDDAIVLNLLVHRLTWSSSYLRCYNHIYYFRMENRWKWRTLRLLLNLPLLHSKDNLILWCRKLNQSLVDCKRNFSNRYCDIPLLTTVVDVVVDQFYIFVIVVRYSLRTRRHRKLKRTQLYSLIFVCQCHH